MIVPVLGVTIYASMRATRAQLPKKIEKGADENSRFQNEELPARPEID